MTELLTAEFDRLRWVIPGLIPEGLTLMVSAPKVGKSLLVFNIVSGVIQGKSVLGRGACDPMDVLIICPDDPSPRRAQERMRKVIGEDFNPRGEFQLEAEWATLEDGGGDDLRTWLKHHPQCGLVFIDTVDRLRGEVKISDRAKADERVMAELKAIADDYGVAIVGTTHDRKLGADDYLDTVAGTKKLVAGADTILLVKRPRGSKDAMVHMTGRDVEDTDFALIFDYPFWLASDKDPRDIGKSDIRLAIVDYLREHGKGSPSEIAEHLNMPVNTVNQRIYQMKLADEVWQPSGPRTPYALVRETHRNNDNNVTSRSLHHYHYYESTRNASKNTWLCGDCGGEAKLELSGRSLRVIPHHLKDCKVSRE